MKLLMVLSSKTLRRREEGVTWSMAGDKRNQMRQKFPVFFSMESKQTNKQTNKEVLGLLFCGK